MAMSGLKAYHDLWQLQNYVFLENLLNKKRLFYCLYQ